MKRVIYAILIVCMLVPFCGVEPVAAKGQGDGICNGPEGALYILVVGTDTRNVGYLYGLGDSTMVIRVDFLKPGSECSKFSQRSVGGDS